MRTRVVDGIEFAIDIENSYLITVGKFETGAGTGG
jgi:hypothetical protein